MALGVPSDKTKREIPPWLTALLEWDKKVTKAAFDLFDRRYGYVKHRSNLKFLEVSCHGLPWLGGVIVMLYMGSQNLELWMNLLVMLIIDIVLVAVVKAISRRKRPSYNTDDMAMTVGVDKFSFPSGHASRAAAIVFFFVMLYPLNPILALPVVIWGVAVMVSRVLLGRHHILDVLGGVVVGLIEYLLMTLIWMDKESAASWSEYLGAEDPWSSA